MKEKSKPNEREDLVNVKMKEKKSEHRNLLDKGPKKSKFLLVGALAFSMILFSVTSAIAPSQSTVILNETFEGAFPGAANTGDWEPSSGLDYWKDTNYRSHSGSWSGWCAQIGSQSSPVTVWTEDFDTYDFPGSDWTVGDWTPANGPDYWDDTNYMGHDSTWSCWCAEIGTQSSGSTVTIWSEGFEGAFPGSHWVVDDLNTNSGLDYWKDTSYRSHSGSWSGWCAQTGDQHETNQANSNVHNYDDDMDAYMYRSASLSGYSSVSLSYSYWLDCEQNYDKLQVLYFDGSFNYIDAHTGNSNGWQSSTVSIPTSAIYVGFYFYSDNSIHNYEGAYVDDITLTGTSQEIPNNSARQYDNYMDSYMYRSASLSGFGSASLSYWYWLDCEPDYDYLQVMYYSSGSWNYIDKHTGYSHGWQSSTVSIPTSATQVGFYFHSDESNNIREGAYVDDATLTGYDLRNELAHQYDNDQNSYMYWSVNLAGYNSVSLSYWYWDNCERNYDYLQVIYYSSGAWQYIDTHSGDSGGWQSSTVSIPTSATQVGFYFHSDESNYNYEGAFIDDILLEASNPSYVLTVYSGHSRASAVIGTDSQYAASIGNPAQLAFAGPKNLYAGADSAVWVEGSLSVVSVLRNYFATRDFESEPLAFGWWGTNHNENFVVYFYGSFMAPEIGTYGIATESDDGSIVAISGPVVVNNYYLQSTTRRSGNMVLNPGIHYIYVKFWQGGGPWSFRLQWQPPNQGWQDMPVTGRAWVYNSDYNRWGGNPNGDFGQIHPIWNTATLSSPETWTLTWEPYTVPDPPASEYLSNFDTYFATNNVKVIYPSDNTPKPLGCLAAMVNDWTASAFVTAKLQSYTEGLDTASSFVNQASGRPEGSSGQGIVTFGGPVVNPVVKYSESSGTPSADRAPIRFYNGGNTLYFQHWDGSGISGASLPTSVINNDQDMFVIEVVKDSSGRYIMICYGFGWKGTYAAGKYFHTRVYPNLSSYNTSWIIVKWQDSNGDGLVNNPGDGDTYTEIMRG
jgi:hypothetical protein